MKITDELIDRLPVDPFTRPDFDIFQAAELSQELKMAQMYEDRAQKESEANGIILQEQEDLAVEDNPQKDQPQDADDAAINMAIKLARGIINT